jgi:hypothetical protein
MRNEMPLQNLKFICLLPCIYMQQNNPGEMI